VTDPRAAVEAALARLLPGLDDLLASLVAIPSVGGTPAESHIQHVLAARLDDLGLEVDRWPLDLAGLAAEPGFPGSEVARTEAWGVVARLPGSGGGRSLLLNAHTDVVPVGDPRAWTSPPFAPTFRGTGDERRLVGRGACDMKGGLAAACLAVAAVSAAARSGARLAGDVLLAPVVGEEDGGLGTYGVLRRGWRADGCVIPEPTALDLVAANAGALTFRLTLRGRSTHASRRTEGVSVLDHLPTVLQALRALEERRNTSVDPLLAGWPLAYPLSIGRVSAGDWASSVPDLLVAEGRYGVALGEPVDEARAAFEAAVAAACAGDPWLAAHPGCYPPIVVNITDGEPNPGSDPAGEARQIMGLSSGDGNVLLYNIHISSLNANPVMFPDAATGLPDKYARFLFDISSVLPDKTQAIARQQGFPVTESSRGFAFNADMVQLISFLDIGTRPVNMR